MSDICFITAIYGNYEYGCKPFIKQTVETDFICFTDNPEMISNGWILDTNPYHLHNPSPLDNHKLLNSIANNTHTFNICKYYKIAFRHIPRLQNYKVIVWIDGTIEMTYPEVSQYILDNISPQHKIMGWHHEFRNGKLIDEAMASRFDRYTSRYWFQQEQPFQDVEAQYRYYVNEGYDESYFEPYKLDSPHFGVWLTCFVAFKMDDPEVIRFLDLWYLQVLTLSTQDQISFPFVVQRTGLIPFTLPNQEVWGDQPHQSTMFYKKHVHDSIKS